MPNPPPYTWRPESYHSVAPPPRPPMPVLLPMPVLVTPCVAVCANTVPAPLEGIKVAGSDTAAKGKEMVVVETKMKVSGTSSKTVTKTAAKKPESKAESKAGSKAPSKAPSKVPSKAPSKVSSKAPSSAKAPSTAKPPSKPASAAPAANSTASSAKQSSASCAAKTSAAVVAAKTIVSVSTAVSSKKVPSVASSTAVSAAAGSTTSAKTTASQKAAKAKAITAPTPPLPGMKLMYAKHHTCLHVLRAKVWEVSCTAAKSLVAKTFFVPCNTTAEELIEQLLGKQGEGWALTEVVEKGDGEWMKGGTVVWGDGKARGAVKVLGWSEKRGAEREPVWVVLHQM